MPQFEQFTPPQFAEGDMYKPKDNIGHILVVKPLEVRSGIVTENSPDGTDAIACDIIDLDTTGGPAVFRDALLFGGALVDGFKGYLGKLLVVRLESRNSKNGRKYPVPAAADDAEKARAEAYFATNPDPFAPQFHTVDTNKAPF
jgi:hypothetical protein